MSRMSWRWIPVLVVATVLPWPAAMGQTFPGQSPPCGKVKQGQELQKLPLLGAIPGSPELKTELDVQLKPLCVPTKNNGDGTWDTTEMKLRTYVFTEFGTGNVRWGYPGPTLRLRKANEDDTGGQRLTILLKNNLPPETDSNACGDVCPANQACDCSPAAVQALIKSCTAARPPQGCCCVAKCTQQSPNCFHGANTTNLHFHGSHASPQPPQDFVLLDLKPFGSKPSDEHGAHGVHGEVVVGEYKYSVDPFGWTQPEGSHWYHPHKHGSVGGQIANGMAGALIIDGPFDDWLKQYYAEEKLIVIQQINQEENFYAGPAGVAPQFMVNGQIQPNITVKPGQMQRWRFVNATMSPGALIQITFPEKVQFRQIAMDGVRFSPVNYGCQPLFNFNPNSPSFPCAAPAGNPTLRFAPGNRADFLVLLPTTETPRNQPLRVERKIIPIEGDERGGEGGGRRLLMQREEAMAPGPAEPALFTIVVDDGIAGNERRPRRKGLAAGAAAPAFPTQAQWPPMPAYLRNITDQELIDPATGKKREVKMTFQQFISGMTPAQPWPYNQSPLNKFTIDGRQFDSSCANVTTTVGTAAEWTVGNDTLLPHPFHIHTNPFQLISVKGVPMTQNGAEPVWMDTFSMPNATATPKSPPTDPATPIVITTSQFVTRQRYEQFTGEYVLHCHFLGHEDRGMMFSVQTVCSDKHSTSAGKYGLTRYPEECAGPGPFPDPLPPCR